MTKTNLGAKGIIFPGAVLIIGTYDENGKADAMNAAWGGQCGPKHIALNLSAHKTTDNIALKKAFTIAFGDADHVKESDYVGLVSANDEPNKLEKAGLTVTKSSFVDAPVINEFPLSLECKVVSLEKDSITGETRVVGEIVNVSADDAVLNDGKVDWDKISPLIFDGANGAYRSVGAKVADAFRGGNALK